MVSSVVIGSGTIAASTLELEVTGLDHDEIRVWCDPANGVSVDIQVSNDNGATWISTGYDTQVLGSITNVFNDNNSALRAATGQCRFNLYNLGIAAPTMLQGSGTKNDPKVYWGVYPVAEVHDAIKLVFSGNSGGIDYEITGTPSSRAELTQTIDFSSANLTTTPTQITGLDGYAALRYVISGTGTGSPFILMQYRPSGGAFITGSSYNFSGFNNDGEFADTRAHTRIRRTVNPHAVGLIYGFGIESLTAQNGIGFGDAGATGPFTHMTLETANESIMDAIQIFTDTGTISTGTMWLMGEKKAA